VIGVLGAGPGLCVCMCVCVCVCVCIFFIFLSQFCSWGRMVFLGKRNGIYLGWAFHVLKFLTWHKSWVLPVCSFWLCVMQPGLPKHWALLKAVSQVREVWVHDLCNIIIEQKRPCWLLNEAAWVLFLMLMIYAVFPNFRYLPGVLGLKSVLVSGCQRCTWSSCWRWGFSDPISRDSQLVGLGGAQEYPFQHIYSAVLDQLIHKPLKLPVGSVP
jgi:hypothetical protein